MSASHTLNGKTSRRLISKTLIPLVCLCLLTSSAMAAESPQAVIQNGTQQVLNILKQYPEASRARVQQIQEVINRYFDFEGMARLAVGPQWKRISPEKQREFTDEYKRLLFATYMGAIQKYANQSITYLTRSRTPGYAMVEAAIYNEGNPIYLDYFLHPKDGNWKVYDVSVSGMSLAVRYRDQFNSFLANKSFDDLVASIKEETSKVCRGGHC